MYVRFGRREALTAVTVEGRLGVHALLGPNGAGKTSLLRVLLGELRADQGVVRVEGMNPVTQYRRLMRIVGWMSQQPQLPQHVSISDFVTYAAWLKGLSWKASAAVAAHHLEAVELSSRSADKIGSLSGGMQRRAAFAAAVAHSPRLLLLDEPMVGLDPEQRSHLADLIRLYGETTCVVLSTHMLEDLPHVANRILVLSGGTLRFDGDYKSFAGTAAGHDPRAAYLQVMSSVDRAPS